jgi:RNA polymerase sigma-B factor
MTDETSMRNDAKTSGEETRVNELFGRLAGDASVRDELVEIFYPLAESLAKRYRNHGEPLDDLVQVAALGLIKAIDRFDTDRGVPFSAYATPTILGELKRHFRDRTWSVRMPRRLQENAARVRSAVDGLTQSLGHSPTIAAISQATDLSEEEILEATEALQAYSAASLDTPIGEGSTLQETLPAEDDDLTLVEGWADVAPLLKTLPDRERRILVLRFFNGLTQTEIAREVGVSQMHVSRMLSKALEGMRERLSAPDRD